MVCLIDLPPEILQLVVDEVYKAFWEEAAWRAEGRNISLVCKALLPFGTALIFRELSLRGLEHDRLFQRVLGQPDIPTCVSSLTYTDSRAFPSAARLALLERLLPACTALTNLHIYAAPSTINRIVGVRGLLLPANLTSLTLRSVPFLDPLDVSPILSTIATFRSLRHLDLLISIPILVSPQLPRLPSKLPLPLRSLALSFPPSNAHNRHVEYVVLSQLALLVDPSTLTSLDLRLATAEPFLFTWLSLLTSLRELHMHLQHDTVDSHLEALTSTLPSLPLLRNLLIRQRVLRIPRPAHATTGDLTAFLASLPLQLESFNSSLFFPSGVYETPVKEFLHARAAAGAELSRFTCEMPEEGGGGGRACEMQRVKFEGERFLWVEVNEDSDV
ncbi:hypothetical protein JCM6882_004958 [Rhodosporidiobolus microsporus]